MTTPEGRRLVVGHVGADVPCELILAAGAVPVRVTGDPGSGTEAADRYLEGAVDGQARSQLERLLDGTYEALDLLLVGTDGEASTRLFYTLRAIEREFPGRHHLPAAHVVDLLHLPHRTSAVYNRARLSALRELLEQWSGGPIPDTAIRSAIADLNASRRLLAGLAGQRAARPPRLSGSALLGLVGVALSDATVDHHELVRARPERPGPRIVLTGTDHDHPRVYELLEATGATIVGEDHQWGSAHVTQTVDEVADPLDALADRVQQGPPSTRKSGIAERAEYCAALAEDLEADGVVAAVRRGDDGPRWDLPRQREAVEARGIPFLALPPYDYADPDGTLDVDAFKRFVARLPQAVAP